MTKRRHRARHEVVLAVVALWNLGKCVLRTCHAACPNLVLDFTGRRCDQICDYARLHVNIEVEGF